ncbi:probable polygalacturonase At3g15720 [Lactuca sativa]|uniref:probable polygalacturonase At3g15720 n=1 Tax=Lactuca sativa TaxID=4236 RepID=UPI0022AF5CD4|nr:probable polygalacturonase At3g15720 [Lactuca sativa]
MLKNAILFFSTPPFLDLQGFLMVVLLSMSCLSFGSKITSVATYDVTSYGAKGDGNTVTPAFLRAWDDLCGDMSPEPTLIIPSDKTFLINPVAFNGPCKSQNVNIKLLGNITAPKILDGWKGCIKNNIWIYFTSVQGLKIQGPGQIDGQGSIWWKKEGQTKTNACNRPTALHFNSCNGLQLSGTKHINSPKIHMSINGCEGVDVGNIQIFAPGVSPNTDGIDISYSSHVNIHDSNIQTGDDCVAINGGTYDINVTRVFCGPGHGISIGSLGENGGHDTVEQVRVENCNISGTTNGLRIKTVPYGTGYARGIVFQDIHLVNIENPIIIDQHYCTNSENSDCPAPPDASAVKVSDVTYTNIYGSSATKQAITFNCSGKYNCTEIVTNEVGITGLNEISYCQNTQGKFIDTTPPINCY